MEAPTKYVIDYKEVAAWCLKSIADIFLVLRNIFVKKNNLSNIMFMIKNMYKVDKSYHLVKKWCW